MAKRTKDKQTDDSTESPPDVIPVDPATLRPDLPLLPDFVTLRLEEKELDMRLREVWRIILPVPRRMEDEERRHASTTMDKKKKELDKIDKELKSYVTMLKARKTLLEHELAVLTDQFMTGEKLLRKSCAIYVSPEDKPAILLIDIESGAEVYRGDAEKIPDQLLPEGRRYHFSQWKWHHPLDQMEIQTAGKIA